MAKGKRKSDSGRATPSKASKSEQATDLKVPIDALLKEHVNRFDVWLCLDLCALFLGDC